jgi:hypothetical protein
MPAAKCQQLNISMRFYEFKSSQPKPLTPAQARIKALKDQAKRAQAAVKAERARQKIQIAQSTLTKLESTTLPPKNFKVIYKSPSPYSVWITVGIYRNFNTALAEATKKKQQNTITVQIIDQNKMVVYSV